ncbi:MAG: indole-3-glycerol phosphate synthase TrpC [bacterium]|nr:indole-3-glycerol phosphate synthase TrpC [bacterium]
MDNILDKITEQIQIDEAGNFSRFDPAGFELRDRPKPLDILAVMDEDFRLIAEIKKASPSKGIIRHDFLPVELAKAYAAGGASAISVLTESNFFAGKKEYLTAVKAAVDVPVLRKDFIIHPFQVYEAFNLGADFILLIVACLTDEMLAQLYCMAKALAMEVLVEVHNEAELKRALKLEPELVGINNRDLRTFEVSLDTSLRLRDRIPPEIHVISESGIKNHKDIERLKYAGFSGVLVGESLVREADVSAALRRLLHG